jgi:hypothetical protein
MPQPRPCAGNATLIHNLIFTAPFFTRRNFMKRTLFTMSIFCLALLLVTALYFGLSSVTAQRQGPRRPRDPQAQAAPERTNQLKKYEVQNATARKAVCNDGSPAVYYFRPGAGEGRKKWVIFLQGGGACSSDAECAERWKNQRGLMTSNGANETAHFDGIFSLNKQHNPDFADFNHVHVKYCSSDTFLGDTEHTINGQRVQFRGHHIVNAVIEDLMNPQIIRHSNLREATEVIFCGSSAGAFGAQNNIDRLSATLSWAKVKGILDSSWKPIAEPYGANLKGKPVPTAESGGTTVHSYWNSVLDDSCVAGSPGKANYCSFTMHLYPFLSTPVFIYRDQRDRRHVGDMGAVEPYDKGEVEYLKDYMAKSRASLKDVKAFFAPAIGEHTALAEHFFYTVKIEGHTFAETLGNWYHGRSGPVRLMTDEETANKQLLKAARGNAGAQ